MDRREFIRSGCMACGALALAGILPAALQSCTTLPMLKTETGKDYISIAKSKLAPEKNLFVLRNADIQYDVLLVRNPDKSYYALYMQCSHNDNPVTANEKGLYCNMHGSSFDLMGKPINGPANNNLKQLNLTQTNDTINIYIS